MISDTIHPHYGQLISRSTAKERGIRYYFTGNPCGNGHISIRYASNGKCLRCQLVYEVEKHDEIKARAKSYRKRNEEKIKESKRIYRKENRDLMNEKDRLYYQENRESRLEYQKDYYQRHQEERIEYQKQYQVDNRKERNEYHARWRIENIEIRKQWYAMYRTNNINKIRLWTKISAAKRRAAKLNRSFEGFEDEIKSIYAEATNLREQGYDVHVDHIIPLQGKLVSGLHVPWNLQIIDASTNLTKSNKFEPYVEVYTNGNG